VRLVAKAMLVTSMTAAGAVIACGGTKVESKNVFLRSEKRELTV